MAFVAILVYSVLVGVNLLMDPTAVTEAVTQVTEAVVQATEAAAEVVTTVTITSDQYLVLVQYLNWIAAFGLFFVIVALCYFGYKFFRIFF